MSKPKREFKKWPALVDKVIKSETKSKVPQVSKGGVPTAKAGKKVKVYRHFAVGRTITGEKVSLPVSKAIAKRLTNSGIPLTVKEKY
jgi:hypothetical protein